MALVLSRKLVRGCTSALLVSVLVWVACNRSESASKAMSPTALDQQATSGPGRRFKVATWNIRSGMGIRGFNTRDWTSDTGNCVDHAKPVNAWGKGLPQRELTALRGDPALVAFAVQEAWHCAAPTEINGVLGFRGASQERNGVALFARHGFSGPVVYEQIDKGENRWAVGGAVCLDPGCVQTIVMFAAHFGGPGDSVVRQAQRVLELLGARPSPRLFMGDLNVSRIDGWSPRAPCTGDQSEAGLRTLSTIEGAGYTDAWAATQSGEGWTGMATRNGCGEPNGNLYRRIDYVFAQGLRPVSTARFGRAEPGADAPSDHVGVVAEYVW